MADYVDNNVLPTHPPAPKGKAPKTQAKGPLMIPRCHCCDRPLSPAVREALAAYAHDSAWGGWMRYMINKGTLNADGTWTMPAWALERWARQMKTPYAELPEAEKQSDRDEADKMLALMRFSFDGWCEHCTRGLQQDAALLRSGDRDEIGAHVAWLLDRGCLTLARYVIAVPFVEGG